ncbi:MAG: SDR family oxidoreductase [Candidatus Marsarchaeota archaeon]|nr:SDR family oxidoreductase [Candidatus Marsarchaeota archaeon]
MKTALVTGASRGIGAGITRFLSEHNYFVYATYLKDKTLAEKTFKKNENVSLELLDVRKEEQIKKLTDKIRRRHGKLNLLINNAAVDYLTSIEKITSDRWEETFGVRVMGTFLLTKNALPLLKAAKRSTIINITSSWAYEAQPSFPAAAAAEAAKMNFTKTCAVALAKYGIRTHSVNPGVTRTPLWDPWGVDDAGWEKMAKENPLGRNCTPEDVARVIYYLDSEEAEYLNGEEVYVNGGNHLRSK